MRCVGCTRGSCAGRAAPFWWCAQHSQHWNQQLVVPPSMRLCGMPGRQAKSAGSRGTQHGGSPGTQQEEELMDAWGRAGLSVAACRGAHRVKWRLPRPTQHSNSGAPAVSHRIRTVHRPSINSAESRETSSCHLSTPVLLSYRMSICGCSPALAPW